MDDKINSINLLINGKILLLKIGINLAKVNLDASRIFSNLLKKENVTNITSAILENLWIKESLINFC